MDADVVILGAGAAGLAAARTLIDAGISCVVVEARSRVGGRIFTRSDLATPVPVELGAEFLHGDALETVRLARAYHLPVHEIDDERWVKKGSALAKAKGFDDRIGHAMAFAIGRARRRDRSFAEAIATLPKAERELALSYVEGFLAAPAGEISTQSIAKGGAEGPGRSMRIATGYAALANALAIDVAPSIRLGWTAKKVRWSRGRVRVDCAGMTGCEIAVRARAAIVTLPIGVLRTPGQIVFAPALDAAHVRALEQQLMGNVVKVTLRFREPFWESKHRAHASFFHAPKSAFPTFWTSMPVHSPVIVAWAGGPDADALEGLSEQRLAEVAVDSFADLIGVPRRHAAELLEACFFHDWRADPFARGAYAYALVGGAAANERFARPQASTLFFGGEHTVTAPEGGTVEGALASGERAAREALHALGAVKRAA